jgi:hypothetical protein
LARAVKRVRFVETPQEVDMQGYLAKEPFSDAWDLTTYVHTPSTRRATKYVVKDLPGIVDLEEVYSVSGPWEGENLVDALAAKGKFAIVAKKKGGDQALAYKVFTGVLKQT